MVALGVQKQADLYLPCSTRVHTYGNRDRRYKVPLFNGYVFGRMPEDHVAWYRSNNNVANVIPVVSEAKLLEPLRAIATALDSGMEMEVLPPLTPGTQVLLTAGPLKGLETEVHEISGTNKVIIQLEMIQKIVAIEVEVTHLKRID